eukprot:4095574-Amphidinium_carterae.1
MFCVLLPLPLVTNWVQRQHDKLQKAVLSSKLVIACEYSSSNFQPFERQHPTLQGIVDRGISPQLHNPQAQKNAGNLRQR